MKCPYCSKNIGDMPDHLNKSKKCHKEHADKLLTQLKNIVSEHKKYKARLNQENK